MTTKTQENNPIATIISMFGNQSEFAKQMGVSRQAVAKWLKDGEIPMRRVQIVSDMTNIPIWVLNPTYCKKPKLLRERLQENAVEA